MEILMQVEIQRRNNYNVISRMTQLIKTILIILSVFLLMSFNGFSQSATSIDSTSNALLIAARDIMTASGTCALITQDQEGRSRVRVMDPFLPDENFVVWFGTNPKSRKVDQIKNDPRVTLYYFDKDASGYVMIHGLAKLIDDPNEKEMHWKDEWKAFYPDKLKGYMLIKVSPQKMEVISDAHGILGDPDTWEPPTVVFTLLSRQSIKDK